jgi:hypothetical protein
MPDFHGVFPYRASPVDPGGVQLKISVPPDLSKLQLED